MQVLSRGVACRLHRIATLLDFTHKVVLTFESVRKIQKCGYSMKATEVPSYGSIMLHKEGLTFVQLDTIQIIAKTSERRELFVSVTITHRITFLV